MRLSLYKRDSTEGLTAGMETNLRWAKRAKLEERQNGFLDGLEEAGRSATEFLGGIFGPGPASTSAPSVETPSSVPTPATSAIPTTRPTIPKETIETTAVPIITPRPSNTKPAQSTPSITSIIESITSPTSTNRPTSPSTLPEETLTTQPPSKTTPPPSTLQTSTFRPENTENPVSANTLTETSSPASNKTSNVTTIVVSIVVIIFGSIAILSLAYFISKRYIAKRRQQRLAEQGSDLVPSPPMKAMDTRFAPGFEKDHGAGLARNF